MSTGINWSDVEVLEVLEAPGDVAFSDIEVLEVLQPLDPGINFSDIEVLEVLHEELTPLAGFHSMLAFWMGGAGVPSSTGGADWFMFLTRYNAEF